MEVKKLAQLQTQNKKFKADEVVRGYFENKESQAESIPQKFLRNSENLFDIEEHSETGILNNVKKRINHGMPYTGVGKDLIAVNCDYPGEWFFSKELKSTNLKSKPHPYSISMKAFTKMKESHESQVITMLGSSGSGKTFNVIHVLDHLITVSTKEGLLQCSNLCTKLFENLHRGLQLLHIMASVMKKHNLESTTCAIDVKVSFDSAFRCTGAKINAGLLDVSLPNPKKGRTYQMLHSLMYSDSNTLKVLGLNAKLPYKIFEGSRPISDLEIFDKEVNQRFFDSLAFIDVNFAEKKSFLETLACVIHLYEMEFISKNSTVEPKNRSLLKKVCKGLGVPEGYFIEKFSGFQIKKDCEERCRDLARYLYNKASDWLNFKIYKRLKRFTRLLML